MWNKIGWTLIKSAIAQFFVYLALVCIVVVGVAAVAGIITAFNRKHEDIHQVLNYVFVFGLIGFCFFTVLAMALDEKAIEILPQ